MSGRMRFNPKRRLLPRGSLTADELAQLAERARYGGNPEHKRAPGDFGLTPPAAPNPKKTWCDSAGVFRRAVAEALLRQGLERGLISQRWAGDWPQNVWSVADDGHVFEAQLENPEVGSYHGYPMPAVDPLRDEIVKAWEQA